MNGNVLSLKKDYFENDAIVLKGMKSKELIIKDQHQNKLISLEASDYPYYGIWAKSPFPFICLEPWDGIADKIDASGELTEKEGIISLQSFEVVFRRLAFRFF
jgi:galactose mutarotase-like enzyme